MTQYAVGDIQGCYRELIATLEKINFDSSQDELWVAGDLINRGPESAATLDFCIKIRSVFGAYLAIMTYIFYPYILDIKNPINMIH